MTYGTRGTVHICVFPVDNLWVPINNSWVATPDSSRVWKA